jgi:hypothetical protein
LASASAGRGGGSRKASCSGPLPQAARSSAKDDRSAARISAGAAAALVGGSARHAHGFEPRHPDIGLVAGHAGKPAVDDDAHALDRDRGFGNGGRKHDFAAAKRGRRNGAILLPARQRAVQRDNIGRCIDAAFEQCLGAADFGGAGQKREQRARFGTHHTGNDVCHLWFNCSRIAADIARLDRKGASFARNHRCAADKLGNARAVDRRRHDDEPQIFAQTLLDVAGECEAEIGVERPLVEFVKNDRRNAVEHGIVEDQPGENAFGDDLDAGFLRDFRAETHPQPHRIADPLAKRLRHPRRGGARGEPARLQHQDAARLLRPVLATKHQRHPRGLAGAGRRDQHGRICRAQRRGQVRQCGVNRQRRKIHS